MKIKMLNVGKYSWDGKSLIVRHKDCICVTAPDDVEKLEADQVHEGVAKQWLRRGICKEIVPRKKKVNKAVKK